MTEKQFQKILERQRRREARKEKSRKDRENLMKVGRAAATIGAVVGTYALGKKAIKKGIPAKIVKDRGFKDFNKNAKAVSDFVSGYQQAIASTIKTKKFGIFTDDSSELLAKNFKKYLGDYKSKGEVGSTPTKLFKLLQDRGKLLESAKANLVADRQVECAKNVIAKYAKGRTDEGMVSAKSFMDDILEKKRNEIFAGTYKKRPTDDFDFVTHELNKLRLSLKEAGDLDGFDKEFGELIDAIASDGGFKTKGGKTSGESFFNRVINNNKSMKADFDAKMKKFHENTLKDISTTMKQEDSFIGKVLESSGAERLTVEDVMRDPSLFKGYDGRKYGKGFDPVKALEEIKDQLDDDAWREFSKTVVDPALIKDGSDIVDLRHFGITKDSILNHLAENVEIPFVGIKPFQYVRMLNRSVDRTSQSAYMFARGTMMDTINNGAGALTDDYYVMGSVLRNSNGDIINDSVRLISNSPYNVEGNVVRRMTGRAVRDGHDEANLFQKVTGVGLQGTRTYWDEYSNWRMNKQDPLSYRNLHEKFIIHKHSPEQWSLDDLKAYTSFIDQAAAKGRKTITDVDGVTIGFFDPSEMGSLEDNLSKNVKSLFESFTQYDTKEDMVDAFLLSDADEVIKHRVQNILERNSNTQNYSGAFKEMQWQFFHDIGEENVEQISKDLFKQGKIGRAEFKNLENIQNALLMSRAAQHPRDAEGLEFYVKALTDDSLSDMLTGFYKESKKRTYELPHDLTIDPFEGNKMIVIGNSKNTIANTISNINETMKKGGSGIDAAKEAWDYVSGSFGEMGFGTKKWRAGAGNMAGVTNKSIGSYFYLSRLSDSLDSVLFGLDPADMTSTQDIAKNLYLKRILLPMVAISAVAYTNDMVGEVTGQEPSDVLAGTYARMTLDIQAVKDATGLNKMTQKWGHVLDGFDRLYETPIGMAAKYASFGILGEDRGYEDLEYYYERGEAPVRKGRYWPIGSNTPWRGGRIEQWRPSWYRRVIGEPEMTDSLWGSEHEYWSQHWLPTLHNPIGPLKRLIDPYHWERKHQDTRPFAVSGGIQELEGIPLVGPILDGTVGRIIKPTIVNPRLKSAHEERIENINNIVKDQYWSELGGGAEDGGYTGYAYGSGGYAAGGSGGSASGGSPVGYGSVGGPGGGSARASTYQALTNMNQAVASQGDLLKSRSADIDTLRDDFYIGDLSTAADPNALSVRLSDMYYSAVEVGGIYGFMTEQVLGDQEPDMILENSSWAFSTRRQFWDERLGSFDGTPGGNISEIYRRFLPNDRKIDTYNPIRNQMPDWLPSYENYFVDFLHGDPYTKVPNGEELLPGAGYEAINKLHSDPYFGRYGALDRMKILGNVAPWSEQYKYYSKVVTTLHDEGVISDEDYKIAQVTREQVRERKKKYDFADRKFSHAGNLEYQNVTVDTVLDDYSFTTVEDPGIVYKLAGIDMPNQDADNRAAVEEYLNSVIYGGAKVKVGITEDGLNFESSDTRNTVKASVYAKGDNVQRRLIRQFDVEADYDQTDDASVDALYTFTERQVGKVWEVISHADLPVINKYIGNRSALEEYERSQVYGKEFQKWTLTGSDYIKPTINKIASKNPINATLTGALIGAATGAFAKNKKAAALTNAIIGGTIGGGAASIRTVNEAAHRVFDKDYAWIPKETQERREINEYFDKLRYVKYKGLYEKAAHLSRIYEGFDPDKYNPEKKKPYLNPRLRKELDGVRRWLSMATTDGHNMDEGETREKIKLLDEFINGKEVNEGQQGLGVYGKLALQFKNEYESTVFGADPYGDFTKIYAALPKSDRPFFQKFMTADPQERARILRLVPKDQRKFYEAKWGKKVRKQSEWEKRQELNHFFRTHGGLPDDNWDGWEAGESLEKVKIKFLDKIGEDVGNYGYFKEDVQAAKDAPRLGLNPKVLAGNFDSRELKRVLKGRGLRDVEVFAVASYVENPIDKMRISMHVKHDRTRDMERVMYSNIGNYV